VFQCQFGYLLRPCGFGFEKGAGSEEAWPSTLPAAFSGPLPWRILSRRITCIAKVSGGAGAALAVAYRSFPGRGRNISPG